MHNVTRILHILDTATLEEFYFSSGTVHQRFLVGIQKLHFYFLADFVKTEISGNKDNDPRTQILWTFLR
jgi:hypothetical protein